MNPTGPGFRTYLVVGGQEGLKIDYDDATYEESVKVAGKMKDRLLKPRVLSLESRTFEGMCLETWHQSSPSHTEAAGACGLLFLWSVFSLSHLSASISGSREGETIPDFEVYWLVVETLYNISTLGSMHQKSDKGTTKREKHRPQDSAPSNPQSSPSRNPYRNPYSSKP